MPPLPDRSDTPQKTGAVLLLAILLIFVSVQGDGFWRQTDSRPLPLAVGAVLLITAILALLTPRVREHVGRWCRVPVWRAALVVAAVSQLASGVLFILSAQHYRFAGYQQRPLLTAVITGGIAVGILSVAVRRTAPAGRTLLILLLLATTAPMMLAIATCPIVAQRSDMLPLILSADRDALHGQAPYHYYNLPSGMVFLTYLPATWLSYLPAQLLHIDPRWITLLCCSALGLLLYKAAREEERVNAMAVALMFFCSPYLQYRHEIYTSPDWLATAAGLLLAFRGKTLASAALLGVAIAMSQFTWVLFPFYLLYFWQSQGIRSAVKVSAVAMACALALTAPFLLHHSTEFFFGVLGHWENLRVNARPVNFSLLLAEGRSVKILSRAQALLLGLLFLWCVVKRSCRELAPTVGFMAIALTIFVLLNLLVWGYFFLLIGLLLLIYVLGANEWLRGMRAEKAA